MKIQDFPLWESRINRRAPIAFDLEITARCNNDCRHCYINLPANDKNSQAQELTLAEIESIGAQAVDMGVMWCLITGGEPLLRPDFEDIYLALKRKGLLVSVFTNATLIRPSHIALFKKYPPRDLEVTIYGSSKEVYERVTRRPGSFNAFERGLSALLEAGIRVRLKGIALRSRLLPLAGREPKITIASIP